MPTLAEIAAATTVVTRCPDEVCIEMVPPTHGGHCGCALIALLALEAAERAKASSPTP